MSQTINVMSGDATKVECDTLVSLINSGKMWFGGMDGAIMRTGGRQFHQQAAEAIDKGAKDGDAIYALGSGSTVYKSVVFVVDDLKQPLHVLVQSALACAFQFGCKSVVMPALRCGVMAGVVEKTAIETVQAIINGVQSFFLLQPDLDMSITFVVYQDPATLRLLEQVAPQNSPAANANGDEQTG